jgi:hypothetical protein
MEESNFSFCSIAISVNLYSLAYAVLPRLPCKITLIEEYVGLFLLNVPAEVRTSAGFTATI